MGPMGVLLTLPNRSYVQVQVPVEATSWGLLGTIIRGTPKAPNLSW
jgi:hypothetical protein